MWDTPVPVQQLVLAPAERADVLVDFRKFPGARLMMKNHNPKKPVSTPAPSLEQVMQIRVGTMISQPGPHAIPAILPGRKADLPHPVRTRYITLNEIDVDEPTWFLNLNGVHFDEGPVTERPQVGTVEDWVYVNLTADTHPMHTHLVTFQVVGRTPFDAKAYEEANEGPHGVPGGIDPTPFATGAVSAEALSITMPADPSLPEPVHEQECFLIGAVHAGDPEEGMPVLQPLRELAKPLADISQPMPFAFVQSAFDGFFPRGQLHAYWKSAYLAELTDDVIEIVARRSAQRPTGLTFVDVYPMGGAVNRIGSDETAFGERSAPWMVSVNGNWTEGADDEANVAWVREVWSELDKLGIGSTYLNFTGAEDATSPSIHHAFGRNLERLAEIKAVYDPDNLFRRNNNITPASR